MEMIGYLIGIWEREDKKKCYCLILLSLVSHVVDVFCYSMIIYIINSVIRTNQALPRMTAFALFMGVVSVLKIIFDMYRCKISTQFVYRSAQKLSMKLYEVIIKENLGSHNQKSASQALMIVQGDAVNCVRIIIDGITICTNFLTMSGYGIIFIHISKWAGVVSCIILLICALTFFFFYRGRIEAYGEKYRALRIKVNAQIALAYGAFREIKIDDRSAYILDRYQDISSKYAKVQSEFDYENSGIGVLLQNAVLAVMFIALSFFLMGGSNLPVVLGLMVSYITTFIRMIPMVYGILSGINDVSFLKKSYKSIRENIVQYEEIKNREETRAKMKKKELSFRQGLAIRNLTFGYHDRVKIFDQASIDIPAGCSVAVTGISGAGKTTLLDLALGLLKPQSGSILYDDYDIVAQADGEGFCEANLGKMVSYIPQTVYLNGETIQNNVAFFETEKEINVQKVEEALKCAQLWEDISQMPEGIHTLIGENGTAISGGQRQRIALARALYKDFELLVMDEATAALDMETEKAVIDSIRHLKGGKTILMVTHHMSLANECDLIYKIENQKIIRVK